MTYHFVTANYKAESILLHAEFLPHPHSGERIRQKVEAALDEFDLRTRCKVLVSDQGSNILNFANNWESAQAVSCDAHALHNLITVDTLTKHAVTTNLIKKCKKIIKTLYWRGESLTLNVELRKEIYRLSEDGDEELQFPLMEYENGTLVNECPTRWTSIFAMFKSIYQNRRPIYLVLEEMGEKKQALSNADIELLSDLIKFLQPFNDTSLVIEGDKYSTFNVAVMAREELYIHVKSLSTNVVIRKLQGDMLEKWDTRLPHTAFHDMAYLLDPRMKDFKTVKERISIFPNLLEFVVYSTKEMRFAIPSSKLEELELNPAQAKRQKLLEVCRGKTTSKQSPLKIELAQYIHMEVSDDTNFDVLKFWDDHKASLPILAGLARSLFAIPATSAPIERIWSRAGVLVCSRRARLTPFNVKCQLFCSTNYKFIKAGRLASKK